MKQSWGGKREGAGRPADPFVKELSPGIRAELAEGIYDELQSILLARSPKDARCVLLEVIVAGVDALGAGALSDWEDPE